MRARIGAGHEPLVNNPGVRVENLSGMNLNVRNVAALELPAKMLGKDRLQGGDTIELHSTLLTHCAAYRVEWQGKFFLRDQTPEGTKE